MVYYLSFISQQQNKIIIHNELTIVMLWVSNNKKVHIRLLSLA